jgi:cystathionine beta-lyase/cystathionine gamma-synthase
MDRHSENASQAADFLQEHVAVREVIYPFQVSHP